MSRAFPSYVTSALAITVVRAHRLEHQVCPLICFSCFHIYSLLEVLIGALACLTGAPRNTRGSVLARTNDVATRLLFLFIVSAVVPRFVVGPLLRERVVGCPHPSAPLSVCPLRHPPDALTSLSFTRLSQAVTFSLSSSAFPSATSLCARWCAALLLLLLLLFCFFCCCVRRTVLRSNADRTNREQHAYTNTPGSETSGMRQDRKPMLRHIYVDGEPANKQTIVICAIVVPIASILITLGLLVVLFRDRLRRSYRRWRCDRHSAHDEVWTHAVGQNGVLVGSNDIALQLQMYAVQINDANDSSDHVALVMPGLLSVMDAPTSSSRGVHGYPRRHPTSASVFGHDGSSADGSEAGSEHTPEMPGVTIAFGTGASTSFAHSAATTSAASYLIRHSAQSAAGVGSRVRNPLAMQIPDRSRSAAGGGADASRPRSVVFPAQYADSDGDSNVESADEGSQSRAVLGEVIVPNVSFSMGYHSAQEEGDSTVDGAHNRSAGRPPHDARLRPRRDSSGPRRRSHIWGSRGSARRRRPSQHLVSETPNLDRHVQRSLAHAGPSRNSPVDVGEGAGVEGPHTMHRSGSTSYGLRNDDKKYVEDDHDSYGSGFEYLCRDDGALIERDGPPPSSSSSASRLVDTNDMRDSHETGTLVFM